MTRRGSKRDVTIAVELVEQIIDENRLAARRISDLLFKLLPMLQRIDRRETRLKPSLRKGFHAKKSDPKRSPAKKTVAKAKKATRRVRK